MGTDTSSLMLVTQQVSHYHPNFRLYIRPGALTVMHACVACCWKCAHVGAVSLWSGFILGLCQVVQDHFEELGNSTPNYDNPGPAPFRSWPVTTDGDVMERELSQQEVRDVMKRMPYQSAPGPDQVTYAYWREVDPTSSIITKILETCRKDKKIPASWKNSTTILIHKGDDPRTGDQIVCRAQSTNCIPQ